MTLTRPQGWLALRAAAPYRLFFGDEAASVAFGAMLRAQPGDVPVHGVIGLDDPADRLPLPRGDELNWVARTCQLARRHLVDERGWPRRAVLVTPFWAPGRRGLE